MSSGAEEDEARDIFDHEIAAHGLTAEAHGLGVHGIESHGLASHGVNGRQSHGLDENYVSLHGVRGGHGSTGRRSGNHASTGRRTNGANSQLFIYNPPKGMEHIIRYTYVHRILGWCGEPLNRIKFKDGEWERHSSILKDDERYDNFMSYRWVAGRWWLWTAMTGHFNLKFAIVFSCLFSLIWFFVLGTITNPCIDGEPHVFPVHMCGNVSLYDHNRLNSSATDSATIVRFQLDNGDLAQGDMKTTDSATFRDWEAQAKQLRDAAESARQSLQKSVEAARGSDDEQTAANIAQAFVELEVNSVLSDLNVSNINPNDLIPTGDSNDDPQRIHEATGTAKRRSTDDEDGSSTASTYEVYAAQSGCWWVCSYIGPLVMAVCLLYAMQALSACGIWRRKFFFDKLCINQTDGITQLACVRAIPGMLMRSNRIVCIIDNEYFGRMWCMFELAMFAKLSDPKGVVFVNLYQMSITFILILLGILNHLIQDILEWAFRNETAKQICMVILDVIAALFYYYFARLYFKSNRILRRQMHEFDVRDCQVANAEDKPILMETINRHFIHGRASDRTSTSTRRTSNTQTPPGLSFHSSGPTPAAASPAFDAFDWVPVERSSTARSQSAEPRVDSGRPSTDSGDRRGFSHADTNQSLAAPGVPRRSPPPQFSPGRDPYPSSPDGTPLNDEFNMRDYSDDSSLRTENIILF